MEHLLQKYHPHIGEAVKNPHSSERTPPRVQHGDSLRKRQGTLLRPSIVGLAAPEDGRARVVRQEGHRETPPKLAIVKPVHLSKLLSANSIQIISA
jgi:hypothetical protein